MRATSVSSGAGAAPGSDPLPVTTGRYLKDRVEVVEGLAPEAALVTAGAGFLNDGDLVRVGAPQAKAN